MSKRFKLSTLLYIVIAISAGAQAPSQPAQVSGPAPAVAPASPVLSPKDIALKRLWGYLNEDFTDGVIRGFKNRKDYHPQRAILDDPKMIASLKAKYYERFAKFYGEALSLEEINYLVQLYSTSLMKRVNDADQKIWDGRQILELNEAAFREAIKKLPIVPMAPSVPNITSVPKVPSTPSAPSTPAQKSVPAVVVPKTTPPKK